MNEPLVCQHGSAPEVGQEAVAFVYCQCRSNAICPVCGFGWGVNPCQCIAEGDLPSFLGGVFRGDRMEFAPGRTMVHWNAPGDPAHLWQISNDDGALARQIYPERAELPA